jgi:dipeptidyl-peptidase 4
VERLFENTFPTSKIITSTNNKFEMKKIVFAILLLLIVNATVWAQSKEITLEDIWQKGTFAAKTVTGLESMPNGNFYTTLTDSKSYSKVLLKYPYNGKINNTPDTLLKASELKYNGNSLLIVDYAFNAKEDKVLISTESEKIYRHSTREKYFVIDLASKNVKAIANGEKLMYCRFSPDGNKVAYVKANNLYYYDLNLNIEKTITTDGKQNSIINGATDWVYEEEFTFSVAYAWSPDSKKIAYYRFDESNVKEFSFDEFSHQLYPHAYRFKYPKAGEENSLVDIYVYDSETQNSKKIEIDTKTERYIPRIKWTNDSNVLSILTLNRYQNQLKLYFCNLIKGENKVVYSENSTTYIDIHPSNGDYVYFLNNKGFVLMSEMDGYNHLYYYDLNGKLIQQITKGNWDVVQFKGISKDEKTLYYVASETNPTEKDIYKISINGSEKKKISSEKGSNSASFSANMNFYINYYSDANMPNTISINDNMGKEIRVLETNQLLKEKMKEYNLSPKEFFTFKTTENIELNAWIIKPKSFDANKKYPVFLTFYGGPGSNTVNNIFDTRDYFWHQMLAQKGYIVMCLDNRGTGRRGVAFKNCTYLQLGKYEVADQIETAKYLGTLSYVDKSRIGTYGWSFGGYLSSLCITKGADYFKTAIAVAPVTNWRYYDNVYTERFMSLPQENAKGYDENSPINHVDKLKGKYLLVHGSADDNVHYQNTMEMVSALIKANKQFDLFIYPDKNHSISGGNTRLHLYTKMTNFILQNL